MIAPRNLLLLCLSHLVQTLSQQLHKPSKLNKNVKSTWLIDAKLDILSGEECNHSWVLYFTFVLSPVIQAQLLMQYNQDLLSVGWHQNLTLNKTDMYVHLRGSW